MGREFVLSGGEAMPRPGQLEEPVGELYRPPERQQCLRHSASSARGVDLPFKNIAVAKGMDVERVLIWPTARMERFLGDGTRLEGTPGCELYVAVTRARASVNHGPGLDHEPRPVCRADDHSRDLGAPLRRWTAGRVGDTRIAT